MKRQHKPHHKPSAFTLAENARIRVMLRQLCREHGTQKATALILGLRDRDGRVVNDVLAGGLASRRLVVALAQHRGTTVDELLGSAP